MSAQNAVQRVQSNGPAGQGLSKWPDMDPSEIASGSPIQIGHLYDEISAIDYSVGVWECTAFDAPPGPYPVDEFMLLLQGTVDMEMPDGTQITVSAGEAFVIPKGFECEWKMPATVRKFFMILDGTAPGGAQNPSLRRITKPDLSAEPTPPPGTIATRDTCFVNHDGRMQVYIDSFPEARRGLAAQTGHQLIHVLNGAVAFPDKPELRFEQGESFYMHSGNGQQWEITAGTRLLVSRCDLPA